MQINKSKNCKTFQYIFKKAEWERASQLHSETSRTEFVVHSEDLNSSCPARRHHHALLMEGPTGENYARAPELPAARKQKEGSNQ